MFWVPLGCIMCKYSIDAIVCGIGGSVPTNKTSIVTSMISKTVFSVVPPCTIWISVPFVVCCGRKIDKMYGRILICIGPTELWALVVLGIVRERV